MVMKQVFNAYQSQKKVWKMQADKAKRIKTNVDLRERIWRDYQDYAREEGNDESGYCIHGVEVNLYSYEYEVRIGNVRIEYLKELNEAVAAAKAEIEERKRITNETIENHKMISEIEYDYQDNMLTGSIGDIRVGVVNSTLSLEDAVSTIEQQLLRDPRRFLKQLEGESSYKVAIFHRDASRELKAAYQAAEERKANGGSGVIEGFTGSWGDARAQIKMHESIAKIFGIQAKDLGYQHNPIKDGGTYTLEIASEQNVSHVQRVAALRMGVFLPKKLTFYVHEKAEEPNVYHITTEANQEMLAVMMLDNKSSDREFFIKTVFPMNKEEYFEENEAMDEMYQNDPSMSLEDLAAVFHG